MDLTTAIQLFLVGLLLLISAFFSSSETALFSLSSSQLEGMRRRRNPRYQLIARLLQEPRRLIITILLGNELTNLLLSSICAGLVIALFGEDKSYYNLLIATPLLLLFGEITPKALAVRKNQVFAQVQAPLLETFALIITPVRNSVRLIADRLISLLVGSERNVGNLVSEDMVLTLAREAVDDGVLEQLEAHYINQIFKFGDATVDDVMTLRSNMLFVSQKATPGEVITAIRTHKRDKLVIYKEQRDKVVGLLYVRDLLGRDLHRRHSPNWLVNLARQPMLVPETKPLLELFHQMRNQQISMALVIDEYGGIVGQVGINDLLEFIFGEAPSQPTKRPTRLRKKTRLDGAMEIAEFNRRFHANLPTNQSDTLNGLIIHSYGQLPPRKMCLNIHGIRFTVNSLQGNRIKQLYVEPESKIGLLGKRKAAKTAAGNADRQTGDRHVDDPGIDTTNASANTVVTTAAHTAIAGQSVEPGEHQAEPSSQSTQSTSIAAIASQPTDISNTRAAAPKGKTGARAGKPKTAKSAGASNAAPSHTSTPKSAVTKKTGAATGAAKRTPAGKQVRPKASSAKAGKRNTAASKRGTTGSGAEARQTRNKA